MNLPIEQISSRYAVRRLTEADLPELLTLCQDNPTYYRYMQMEPTLENLREDLTALPRGKTLEDKFFLGLYRDGRLIAVLDLITRCPNPETAFVGWFMLQKSLQGKGTGTAIITELLAFLKNQGFRYVRLGYIQGNQESEGFWRKNAFLPTGMENREAHYTVVVLQRTL